MPRSTARIRQAARPFSRPCSKAGSTWLQVPRRTVPVGELQGRAAARCSRCWSAQCKTYMTELRTQQLRDLAGRAGDESLLVGWLHVALLLLPAPLAAQEGEPIVIGRSFGVPSAALDYAAHDQRVASARAMPGARQRYPVIYLIDGGLAQDFQHIAGLAQLGALSPAATRDFADDWHRGRRPAAPPASRFRSNATWRRFFSPSTSRRSHGSGATWWTKVKPFVEARYRTSGEDASCSRNRSPGCSSSRPSCASRSAFDTLYRDGPEPVVGRGAAERGRRRRSWRGTTASAAGCGSASAGDARAAGADRDACWRRCARGPRWSCTTSRGRS